MFYIYGKYQKTSQKEFFDVLKTEKRTYIKWLKLVDYQLITQTNGFRHTFQQNKD